MKVACNLSTCVCVCMSLVGRLTEIGTRPNTCSSKPLATTGLAEVLLGTARGGRVGTVPRIVAVTRRNPEGTTLQGSSTSDNPRTVAAWLYTGSGSRVCTIIAVERPDVGKIEG